MEDRLPNRWAASKSKRNDIDNETPMYVRPYLEDPVFLQPDDSEVSMLHSNIEEPDDHYYEAEHETEVHQNGFRKTGELCNYDFECISDKCLSWMHKAPACMPF